MVLAILILYKPPRPPLLLRVGWLTILKEKSTVYLIIYLPNNLFTPKLTDPKQFKKTPLAHFLEKATGHQALMVGEKKQWFVPTPYILENTGLVEENLIESLRADTRQIPFVKGY